MVFQVVQFLKWESFGAAAGDALAAQIITPSTLSVSCGAWLSSWHSARWSLLP